MIREFEYTVKLIVQHKTLGTLDYILKTYDASVNINEDSYYNPFVVNSENILDEMSTEITNFCNTKKYAREDIDIISYEVVTDDPYIHIYFSESEADNVYNAEPDITAYVEPQAPVLPSTPKNFKGAVIEQGQIEWTWDLIQFCAYRIYDQNNKIIKDIAIDTGVYIEANLASDKNYTRKIVSYNSEGESIATDYVTVYMPTDVPKTIIPLRPLSEIIPVEQVPVIETIYDPFPAFKTGIGDNLDLLVRPVDELTVNEKFKFETFLEGFSSQMQKHYTAIPFKYKIQANGKQTVTEYIDVSAQCKIEAFPIKEFNVMVSAHVYLDLSFVTKCDVNVDYTASDGTIQNKTVRYTSSKIISSPVKDLFIVNLKEYVKVYDADIVASPDLDSLVINSVEIVDRNPSVTYSVSGTYDLSATCLESETFYKLTKNVTHTLYPYKELEYNVLNGDIEKPKNSFDIEYNGSRDITYEITYFNDMGTKIELVDKKTNKINPKSLTQITADLWYRFVTPYDYTIHNISLSNATPVDTSLFKDLFPSLEVGDYYFKIIPIMATGEYSYKTTTTSTVTPSEYDDGEFIKGRIDRTCQFICSEEISTHAIAWKSTSVELSGTINGKEPMVNDGDGKRDFITVAPIIPIPSNVTDVDFELIVTDTNNKYIDAHFKHETEYLHSSLNGDVITFSSVEYELEETYGAWRGPIIISDEFEINTADTIIIKTDIFNPMFDYATSTMTITDITLKARSLNPNVIVSPVEVNAIDLNTLDFKTEFEFKAKILSPSQNAWAPIIHPGYYYINQHEYFLYAQPNPNGVFSTISEPVNKEFFVSIKAGIDIKSNPDDFIKYLNTKSSLINGEKNNITINADGSINLTQTNEDMSNPTYIQTGDYTTETLSFMTSVNQLCIIWDEVGDVTCDIKAQYEDNTWGEWTIAKNGIPVELSNKALKFKVRFHFTRVDGTKSLSIQKSIYKATDWTEQGFQSTNMIMLDNKLVAIDTSAEAKYISPIYVMEDGIVKFTMNISANHDYDPLTGYGYKVEVAMSDSEDELNTNPTWHDITQLLGGPYTDHNKYLRYQITIPANSLIKLYEVDFLFEGSTIKEVSPVLSNIKISSETPDMIFAGYINKSILCSVPTDSSFHDVTDFTILDTIYPDILASGYSNPVIESLEVNTSDSSIELKYDNDGNSKLKAATTNQLFKDNVMSEYLNIKKIKDNLFEAIIAPIPVMGRPIVIEHPTIGTLKQINFIDDKGEMTLTNTETQVSTGKLGVSLAYTDIDIKSLYITINGNVPNIDNVINNIVYFDKMTSIENGDIIFASYRIKNSFMIDYNYDIDNNKARVLLHLSDNDEIGKYYNMKVYYENDDEEYYKATELELNPLYNDNNTGFIYLTDVINHPKNITLNMTPDVFSADSNDCAYMFIKLTDEYENAVDNIALKISAIHGKLIIENNITNQYGIISAKYYAPKNECVDTITVTNTEYGITATKTLTIKEVKPNVFINVNSDNYYPSNGNSINISTKVFAENLDPYVAKDVTLNISSIEGSDIEMHNITDSNGECSFTIKPFVNQTGSICRIKITCLDVVEYIDIKVVT